MGAFPAKGKRLIIAAAGLVACWQWVIAEPQTMRAAPRETGAHHMAFRYPPSAESGIASSDEDLRRSIIEVSIRSYGGSCPCPYSRDRAGRLCGQRSAYSKPGGYQPYCYPQDVTPDLIRNFRGS